MMEKCLLIGLIFIYALSLIAVDGESPQDHIAKERIKIACHVQKLPLTTQMFDECLNTHKMPYSLKKVFGPCSKLAGVNLKNYAGIFNFTCKEQGKNREKVISCVVKNIASVSKTNDIVKLSKHAMDVAKNCSELVAKILAEEAAAEAKKAWEASMAKANQGFQMPKNG